MMNAEVMAENKPACCSCEYTSTKTSYETHEDQSRVQILIVLRHKLVIVLLSLLPVVFVEPGTMILLSGLHVLFPST